MTHSTADNLYDIEVKDKEVRSDRIILTVETVVAGELYNRNFTFKHRHFGKNERWKKHVKQWIDGIKSSDVSENDIESGVVNLEN
jgi:hypothetical protein